MKYLKPMALILASALASTALFSAGCSSDETGPEGERGSTLYGNSTYTADVESPSDDVRITLIRGKKVLARGENELSYSPLQAGDIVELDADRRFLSVELFKKLGEQIIYSPTGQFTFQVPALAAQSIYESGAFSSSGTIKARITSDEELRGERNLAVNAYDYPYLDEKTDPSGESILSSSAVELGEVAAFPHAYANRVTRNEAGFYARNAIDGQTASDGHGNFPYQSWGYDQKEDAEFVLYFGREVTLDRLGFVLRADFSGTKEHDTYWTQATVVFSDGTEQTVEFEKSGIMQEISLPMPVKTQSVRIKDAAAFDEPNSEGYAALTEFEAYGTETEGGNPSAQKTQLTPTFGGKSQRAFTTSDYSAEEIKAEADRAIEWFLNKTETENFRIPDYNGNPMEVKLNDAGWKDAVYYSGLTDYFLTTGDMDAYYFLRAVGMQFSYLNNGGKHTPHGDNYQIGETYLMLEDLKNANYKIADTVANADYNLARDVEDKKAPAGLGLDGSRDWSHMAFWWCDALYMAMNTYTLLSRKTGDPRYVRAAYEGYEHWKGVLYNETYQLWHRDSTQLNVYTNLTDENGKVPTFWSRGNAWVLAALAKQLLYLDEEEFPEIYRDYEADFLELAASIAAYQREDGTWNASIVDESYYGGRETTGTCGFIYAYCVGLRLGLLDPDIYYPIVQKAYDCVVNECTFESGQVGYMQTTGYQPQNYKSEEYSRENTHEFGMGLYLLASAGMMSLCEDYSSPALILPADPQAILG